MGEKRKARMTNNEKTTKKEKKTMNSVAPSASNDDMEEQSSMHSDSSSQQPSITQEKNNPEEIEESQTITPIDVTNEDPIESKDDNPKIINESTTKSWWSTLVRLFHFGNQTNETKTQLENPTDHETSPCNNESYLSSIKSRRSLHGDSLVG